MPLTLNQIITRIERLARSHRQVNHFYFGDLPEFTANGDITYPAVFLETQPGIIDRVNKVQRYNFRIYAADLVHVSQDTEENETEVLSDMSGVLDDIISMIANPVYQFDWEISETLAKGLDTEKLDDMVAWAAADITIAVEFFSDSCVVPADDVDFDQTINMSRVKIITYDATGSEGNSWTVAGIVSKNVIAAFRAGSYKRIKITVPDTEEIQLAGVLLSDNKGIVTTGVITLSAGDAPIADEKFDFLIYD